MPLFRGPRAHNILSMICPIDTIVCDTQTIQGVKLDVCPRCQGVWLDGGEFKQLMDLFTFAPAEAERIRNHSWVDGREDAGHTQPREFWQETPHRCPIDRTEMKKHYIAGSTIGVDSCDTCHGFWLDGPELAALARYVGPDPLQDAMGKLVVSEMNIPASITIQDAREQALQYKNSGLVIFNDPTKLLEVIAQAIVHLFIR